MTRLVKYSKQGDEAFLHFRGIGGPFQVPQGVQDGLNAATNEWLLENCVQNGMVDPFILGEVMHRNLYGELERRRIAKLEAETDPRKTFGQIILEWAAEHDSSETETSL